MIKIILTDIEGTISSLTFVRDVLFPYARNNIARYLESHASDSIVAEVINQVKNIIRSDRKKENSAAEEITLTGVINTMIGWIDEDKKITPLKTLQGLIWEEGFKKEVFKAHIYSDALQKLQLWKKQGLPLYVYSSGSIFAQKLFFTYNEAGDILSLFSGHFDTTIGAKKDAGSYQKIAFSLNTMPENILFFSDIREELDAALATGMKTAWIIRDGALADSPHKCFSDFDDIDLAQF